MPLMSKFVQQKRIDYFLNEIPKDKAILEIGCGSGWTGDYLKKNGWTNYLGNDLKPPADIVGDIRNWKELGLKKESLDVIIAFEVMEHVDCFKECWELLKPGGMLMITTPVPHFDWILLILEKLGINQTRTSPHNNLIYIKNDSLFKDKKIKNYMILSQWGILKK